MDRTTTTQLASQRDRLAKVIVDEQWQIHPDLDKRHSESARKESVDAVSFMISYLSEALSARSPKLFEDYVEWMQSFTQSPKIAVSELAETLLIMGRVVVREFPMLRHSIPELLTAGLSKLSLPAKEPKSFFDPEHPLSPLARNYLALLRQGKRTECSRMILAEVKRGTSIGDVYMHVFEPVQREIGLLWQNNDLSIAEEHYCTAATQLIMSQLSTFIFETPRIGRSMVATCVDGELHEVGLRMVADFFELAGWDSYYLGSNMPTAGIILSLEERKADVVAIATTLTLNVGLVANLIDEIRRSFRTNPPFILVGGYPFNIDPTLWETVGADGSAKSAADAVALANAYLETRN
jgi:methanogenic corrinoid protein MtbC1